MVKIVAIALVSAIIIVYLKSINSELALLATIASGIIIIFFSLEFIVETYDFISKIIEYTSLDNDFFIILYKILAIGYLVEFGAGIIRDFGMVGLADKLIFVGKLIILSLALPIIYSLFNLLTSMML